MANRVTQAILLALCGIPGVLMLIASTILLAFGVLLVSFGEPRAWWAVGIGFVGYPVALALVLLGSGKWGQWTYAWVFIVLPVSYLAAFAICSIVLEAAGLPPKVPEFFGMLLALPVCAVATHLTLRWARKRSEIGDKDV